MMNNEVFVAPDFKTLFEGVPSLCLVLDPALRIVAASDAYLLATKTCRANIVGRHLFDVFPDNPDDPCADALRNTRASLNRVLQSHVADAMVVQRHDIRKSETEGGGFEVRYWSPLNSPLLNPDGSLAYIIHRVENVTEFMLLKQQGIDQNKQTDALREQALQTEAELYERSREVAEASIKLKQANQELARLYKKSQELDVLKTQFFANVSHELRTPLTLILGPLECMLDEPGLTLKQRRQLESISRNSKRLLKHVNDLLDVAKLDAGKMDIHYVRIDLVPWFRRIASQFDMTADLRQIRYSFSTPETLPGEIDPDMLNRVLVNLLSNAFKFTPSGGCIEARLQARPGEFVFSVADSGPGISAGQHETIFERFRQADAGETRQHAGTGLGLAIAKEFVELHGGRIDVTSFQAGAGAAFEVRLPLCAPASVPVTQARHALGSMPDAALDSVLHELTSDKFSDGSDAALAMLPGRPSVLLVEDNRDMRRFIAETLSEVFNVVSACDGREGYERALTLRPDLIVTDLMMPHMSGDQMVRALREQDDFNPVPILYLTAKTDDELRVRLLQSGAQDYLNKPFLPQELLARAGNLVAMKRTGDTLRQELASASDDLEGLAKELAVKRRQLQTALDTTAVALKQAEQASRVKSYFLCMISHELRTPLSTIQMNAQLLAQAKEAQVCETARPRIERLMRATKQISGLIEGLLEYTRLESGKITTHLECIDIVALTQEVIEAHADYIAPGVHLTLATAPPNLAPLASDSQLLKVVLNNLISNALKFTAQGGVTVRLGSRNGWHVLHVSDTGIGIPEADIERIFLPFEQLEPVQSKSIPGVGLGLALVKQIVDALDGKMEVTSRPDMGSTFRVHIPSQPCAANNAGLS